MPESAQQSPSNTGPIKVLHVSYWLCRSGGGGIQTYLATLTRALEVAVPTGVSCNYAALMPGEPPGYLSALKKNVTHTGRPSGSKLRNGLRLWAWLGQHLKNSDVVHIHGVLSANFAISALACLRGGIPYIVSPHGSLAPDFLKSRRWRAKAYLTLIGKPLLRRARQVAATSNTEANLIKAIDSDLSVCVIPPGIAVTAERQKRAKNTPVDFDLRLAFLGRLTPIKALPILFKSLNLLRDDGINVHLDVIGDTTFAYQQQLQRQIKDMDLAQAVTLHGYLQGEAKREVLARADVFALPSHSESFGFAAVEALALGIPVVVTTGVGIHPEITRHNCGTVVPIDDAHALSQALRMYRDPDIRAQKSANANTCVTNEFSLLAMAQNLQAMYASALPSNPAARPARQTQP